MRTSTIIIGGVVLAVLAGGAVAAYAHISHRHKVHAAVTRALFDEADQNKDGQVMRAEADQAVKLRFDTHDTNRDGKLDPAEFQNALPKPPEGVDIPDFIEKRVKGSFKSIDWNLDGTLSYEEFAAPVRMAVAFVDRDGDGVIKQEDIRSWRHRHGRGERQ